VVRDEGVGVEIAPGTPEYSADVEGAVRYGSNIYAVRCRMAVSTKKT
jgi:hypothetical protein